MPEKLAKTLRVPSYKFIAMAILKNDLNLVSLGFTGKPSTWAEALSAEQKRKESGQSELF